MLYLCVCIIGLLAVVVGSVPAPVVGVNTPTESYKKLEILDANKGSKYKLFWKFNDTHITFEVHVKTTGYVGFGISDNGGMYPGDVVVGWVGTNGSVHFKDYHTVAKAVPVLDKSQDWELLHGEESNGVTLLKFLRKLDTCDTAGDKVIKEGRVHVIYSYNDQDPANDSALFYHGPATRGTKEISLLSEYEQIIDLPADIKRLEFLQRNFIVPNASTTYNCMGFQLPDLGGKHHMIQYEPVITPGNENMIHHQILYRCDGINASMDGVQGNCYARDRPLPSCFNMVVAWVVGGKPFYFPSNVGFSVGAPNDASFYILETHYDNPSNKAGRIDSSGIRVTITKTLRTHDAGILLLGHDITMKPVLPPHVQNFLVKGYCPSDCFRRGMAAVNISEINIFAVLQHSHLLGRAIKTRHFRNSTELPPLMDEPHYDFNFQELTMLPKQRVVKPGDSIRVECSYDTTGKSREVFSGWGTDEEMCNTFLYYYPWMESQFCLSESLEDSFPVPGKNQTQFMNYLRSLDWRDPAVVANYQSMHFNSTVHHQCMGATHGSFSDVNFVEREPANPYQAPANTCNVPIDPVIIG